METTPLACGIAILVILLIVLAVWMQIDFGEPIWKIFGKSTPSDD